jgi:predicted transcriptional regulator
MKGQDILVLLKLLLLDGKKFQVHALAKELAISPSELSKSIRRSIFAGLIDPLERKCNKAAFLEFMLHGFPYVYPVKPGEITRGMPTAHSAPPLKEKILSNIEYVWPFPEGPARGQAIRPIYRSVPLAARNDPDLHSLLALADALRVGLARERNMASEIFKDMVLKGSSWT